MAYFYLNAKKMLFHSLPTLVGKIIKGPTTKIDPSDSHACLSIAQLVVFNSNPRPHDQQRII